MFADDVMVVSRTAKGLKIAINLTVDYFKGLRWRTLVLWVPVKRSDFCDCGLGNAKA